MVRGGADSESDSSESASVVADADVETDAVDAKIDADIDDDDDDAAADIEVVADALNAAAAAADTDDEDDEEEDEYPKAPEWKVDTREDANEAGPADDDEKDESSDTGSVRIDEDDRIPRGQYDAGCAIAGKCGNPCEKEVDADASFCIDGPATGAALLVSRAERA